MKKYEWEIFLCVPIETRWNGNYWVGQSITLVFTEKELDNQLKNKFISGKDRFEMPYRIPRSNISCAKLVGTLV